MTTYRNGINFPLEILEHIVDKDLAIASPQLLSASRELRHCALRHLFKSVEISNTNNTNNRIAQLRDLIAAPDGPVSSNLPGIASYVKDLIIQFSFRKGNFTLHDFFSQPALLGILGASHREGHLSGLTLNMLINPHLEHVKSHGWGDLPISFRDVFASLIRLPSVSSLAIDWLDGLPRELVGSTNLESCALTHSRSPPSAFATAGMKVLKTDHMYTFDGAGDRFCNLREAEVINTSAEDFIQSWTLMKAAGSSLYSLNIVDAFREPFISPIMRMHPDSPAVREAPPLTVVPNLQQLRYSVYESDHASFFVPILWQLFDVSAPHKTLYSIILELEYITSVHSIRDAVDTVESPQWAQLDESWTSGHFPELKTVEIHVKMLHLIPELVNAPGIGENISRAFANSLARTSQDKSLSVFVELQTISL